MSTCVANCCGWNFGDLRNENTFFRFSSRFVSLPAELFSVCAVLRASFTRLKEMVRIAPLQSANNDQISIWYEAQTPSSQKFYRHYAFSVKQQMFEYSSFIVSSLSVFLHFIADSTLVVLWPQFVVTVCCFWRYNCLKWYPFIIILLFYFSSNLSSIFLFFFNKIRYRIKILFEFMPDVQVLATQAFQVFVAFANVRRWNQSIKEIL